VNKIEQDRTLADSIIYYYHDHKALLPYRISYQASKPLVLKEIESFSSWICFEGVNVWTRRIYILSFMHSKVMITQNI
jgi:hypothetical protein